MEKELKELRKELKPLGFKIKTESLSWGRHATYVHVESGEELTFNVATQEQVERWKPLHDHLATIPEDAILVDKGEKIYGRNFCGSKNAKGTAIGLTY
jgi:hypothetical protein